MTIRIVVADDQAMVRKGLRMLLEDEPDMEVVGEAGDLSIVGFPASRYWPPTLIVRTGRRSVAIREFADRTGCVR